MNKEVVLLVGPMGSGKTTYAKKNFKSYFRVSQDEQGRKEHFRKFLEQIKKKEKSIVVDRINHLEKQRKKYLDIARDAGYKTRIVVMNLPFKKCFERVMRRKNHPIFKVPNEREVLKALRIYFKEYEIPLNEEAEKIEFLSDYDPYLLDLSNKYNKFLVVGDVHGCFDELKEMLDEKKNDIDNDTAIVFLGDIVDKGEKIKEVVEFVRTKKNCFLICGNHEEKLKRYLRGNDVSISYGLDDTIKQLDLYDISSDRAQELLFFLESLPYVAKMSDKDFVIHAGLNPFVDIYRQRKEFLLYARKFNPVTYSFSGEEDKFWFEYYNDEDKNIFFGHQEHKKVEVRENVFALDGYCVYGGELRAAFLKKENGKLKKKFLRVKAKKVYFENKYEVKKNVLSFFEKFVSEGVLKKSENDDLVLYSYTKKCVYERKWNECTLKARGIIFEKKTQKVVARPFVKFFNLGENETTQLHNLPKKLEYEVFEKLDGSLGIMYFYNGRWNISTRGELRSVQSIRAEKMLEKYDLSLFDKEYTYLVEIIYPENRVIVDYKNREELVLLAGIKTDNGEELSFDEVQRVAKRSEMGVVRKLDVSFDDVLERKENLNQNEEGFVVRWENGLRVKVKGDEYLKVAKLMFNLTKKSVWNIMKNGRIDKSYLANADEEVLEEIIKYKDELEAEYRKVRKEVYEEFEQIKSLIGEDKDVRKQISKILNERESEFKHKNVFFSIVKCDEKKIDEYIMQQIKPK